MSAAPALDWGWRKQDDPPQPRAAVAWRDGARQLHARLVRLDAARQSRLSIAAAADVLVVLGDAADLPWVDGVSYAAPCAQAAGLWLPTLQRPEVAPDLLMRALQRQHARQPLLLWPEPAAVIPLDRQLPVSPELLVRLAQRWKAAA